jgi:hypothetical protein
MAVDFSLLPPEEQPRINPPSPIVWTIVFFLVMLASVLAVLFFWPKDVPSRSWKLWTSLVLFPTSISALIVLRRYSVYQGRLLDATLSREAARAFTARVFEAASIPLVLIDAAHRFSATSDENTTEAIRNGAVTLVPQTPVAKHGNPVKARWLVVPGMRITAGKTADDRDRCLHVTKWLFGELLDELLPRIQSLPIRLPLIVRLDLANGLTQEENTHLWRECWQARSPRSAVVAALTEAPANLMLLDTWLDQTLQHAQLHATLVVAIQLHALLSATPDDGMAEAGVALLLTPESLAAQHQLPCLAHLHRPVQSTLDQAGDALSHALRWAGADATRITAGWQTGLDRAQTSALAEPVTRLGLAVHTTDLDQTVGHAGIAAPWLALACAASSLADAEEQIILVGHDKHLHCSVMKKVDASPAANESANKNHRDQMVTFHTSTPSIMQAHE